MARARKIMVIRHAEKPAEPPPPNGVDENGTIDPESLSPRGWERAGALVRFFNPVVRSNNGAIAIPNVLIASSKEDRGSKRSIQTITPLAQQLDLDIATFEPRDVAKAASAATTSDGIVLMCWRHENIPPIGEAIAGAHAVPETWPDDRFDLVWIFDLDPTTETYRFTQFTQNLLSGD